MYEILSDQEAAQLEKEWNRSKAKESRGEIRPTTWEELRAPEQFVGKQQNEQPLAYLGRNVLQTIPQSLALARSGLGFGDILEGLVGLIGSEQAMKAADLIMPSHEKAYAEQQQLWPEYMTEERPGDYWAQLAIPQAAATLGSLYYGGPAAAAKSLVPGALAMLGGTAGSEGGEILGGMVGQPQLGKAIGSFAGTHLGGLTGHQAMTGQPLLPTDALPALEEEAAATRYATDKEQYGLARAGKKKNIEEHYKPILDELEQQHQQARTQEAVSIDEFQKAKLDAINKERDKVVAIENEMEALDKAEKPLYEQASNNRNDDTAPLGRLQPRLNYIKHKAELGTTVKEESVINRLIDQINKRAEKTAKKLGIKTSRSMPGILSVDDAVSMLHSINGIAHDQEYGATFYKLLKDMTESLKEFVKTNGSEEHNAPFFEALEKTTQRKNLERETLPALKKETERAIQHIKEQPYTEIAQLENKRRIEDIVRKKGDVVSEQKEALQALGPERYEQVVAEPKKTSKKDKMLIALGTRAKGWGAAGLAGMLGSMIAGKPGAFAATALTNLVGRGLQEFSKAREVFTKYPEVRKQYYNLLRDVPWLSQQAMSQRINHLGETIEKKSKEMESQDISSQEAEEWEFIN